MRLVSFDALRSLGLPDCRYIKSEAMFREKELIKSADWVLFPEYWQINSLLYGFHSKIFPSPASYHLGFNKIEMTYAFQTFLPQHFPQTLILPSSTLSIERILDEMPMPFVAKESRNSMGKGVFLITHRRELLEYANANTMLYVQEYLPIDRDIRLVLIGDKVVCSYWRVAAEGSFHNNIAQGAALQFDEIPGQAIALVEQFAKFTGVNHAGFDIAIVDGHCYFLEFNRLFGNSGLKEKRVNIAESIYNYLLQQNQPPLEPEGGGKLINY